MAYDYGSKKQYGNNNGGNNSFGNENAVTSTGITFFNESAGKFMNFNYWGRMLSLEIATCPAGAPITWDVRKNAQTFKQSIAFTSIADLSTMCEEVYESIKKNGTFNSVGIRVGSKRDCILEISNGENLHLPTGIYLVIYKGLDSGNRTNVLEFYPFDSVRFVRGYDHNTGNMREDINKLGEFKKFYKAVEAAVEAFTMAQAHAISELKKGDKLSTFKALAAVSAALGVDMTKELLPTKTTGTSSYTRNQNSGTSSSNGAYGRGNYGRNNGGYQPKGSYNAPRQRSTFDHSQQNQYQAALSAMNEEPVDINLDVSQLQNVDLSNFPNNG